MEPTEKEPALSEDTPELRRGLRWAIIANAGNMVSAQFFNGPLVVVYAQALNMDLALLGWLLLAMKSAAIIRLPLARWVAIRGKRATLRREWAWAIPTALPVVFAPQLAELTGASAGWALLAGILCYNLFSQAGATAWLPLLQDIVPNERRGRFFAAMRTTWQAASGVLIVGAALYLGSAPTVGDHQVVFAVAWLSIVLRWWGLGPVPEGRFDPNAEPAPLGPMLAQPWSDPTFRAFLAVNLPFTLAWGVLEPYRVVYLTELNLDTRFATFGVGAGTMGAVMSLPMWGALADRIGSRVIYQISGVGGAALALSALLLPSVPNEWAMPFVLLSFWATGVTVAGFGLAQTHSLMPLVPREHQAIYFSTHMVAMLVGSGLGGLLGALWLDQFEPRLAGFASLFAAAGVLLVAPVGLCGRITPASDRTLAELAGSLRRRLLPEG